MKNWERWLLPLGLLLVLLLPDFFSLKWLGVYALSLGCAGIAILLKPVLPDFERREWLGLSVLGALALAHLFWFYPSGYEFALLGRISFFALFWFSWRGFTSQLRWDDFFWPLAAGTVLYSAYGLYCLKVGLPLEGRAGPGALGAALVLFWAVPAPKSLASKLTQVVAGALGLVFLAYADLSVAAAAGAALAVIAVQGRKKISSRALIPAGGTALLAVALFFAFRGQSPVFPSLREKGEIWRHTFHLIRANPLGVGLDRFTFTFPTFHRDPGTDGQLFLSPQNDFLRWLAEDGLVLSLLFLLAALHFLRLWWKKGSSQRTVVMPVAAFFFVEMLWASPLQNPLPMAIAAVVAGHMAASVWKRRMLPAHAGTRALLLVSWLFLLVCLGRALVSRSFERTDDVFRAQVACRAVSSNWRACLNYSSLLLGQGETSEARREVEKVLEIEPWNFVALRHLGVIALKQGDRLEACFITWKYDDLFSGQSALSEQYNKNCPQKWREYFARKRPMKYYRR